MTFPRITIPGLNRQSALFLFHSSIYPIGLFGIADVVLNFYFVSLGYSPETIGVLQGLPRLGSFLTGIPMSLLADRIGAKRITIVGILGVALGFFMMALWPVLPVLIVARFLMGLSYGAAYIVAFPMMMSLTERKYQTHLFSHFNVVTMAATSVGSFIGGYLPAAIARAAGLTEEIAAQSPFAYGLAIAVSGLLVAVSILPMLLLNLPAAANPKPTAQTNTPREPIPWAKLGFLAFPFLIFGVTAGLTFPFYNLFFRTTFDIPDPVVGSTLSFGWLCMGVATFANPWLERRFGRAKALGVTMSIAAIAFAFLSAAQNLALGTLAFVIAVSARNTMASLFQPLLMGTLPAWLYNTSSGLCSVLWSLGWFVSTMISGFWQETYGFGFIMRVVAVGVFLTGLSTFLIFRNRKPYQESVVYPAGQVINQE